MKKEYMARRLEQSRRNAYAVADALARAVSEGWQVHTWQVLTHEYHPNDRNHGHGCDEELVVSVLFVREVP